ncbi:MAG TPA: Npt1/Npt2 family nucleotide transporter [Acidobacteriota bacterium]|jgi:AAA family ATP:ADP antiporter|nr:Npt1/Npt2 family nucleotide transporter [Acidobacteriota bacterium]
MKKPIREIFDFRREEFPVVVLMFLFFFLVIAVFQVLRSLKKGLFLATYGADAELYAKLANILVAALATVVFTYLYNKLARQRLIYVLCLFFAAAFLALAFLLGTPKPGPGSIWGFYLLGDLLSTLMVAAFWAYLTDISDTDQAKRLFGAIGAGGVVGGWVGISFAKVLRQAIGMQGFLLISAAAVMVLAMVTFLVESWILRKGVFRQALNTRMVIKDPKLSGTNAAWEGARLVMTSKYLAAIVAIMAFYEVASQIMDYQFGSLAAKLSGVVATQAFIINVYFYANLIAVIVQFILVSLIMRKLGLVVALFMLPVAAFSSSVAFLVMPTLFVASLLVISDNGLNYSIQQTSRESLYVPTTSDDKYKARAFTNMFVQRLAKGVGIVIPIALGIAGWKNVRFLSLITLSAVVLMALCSIYAGRRFAERSAVIEGQRQAA